MRSTCRLVYCIVKSNAHVALISQWWMSSTPTLCGRMIIASTNYQTGHSGVAFATLAARVWGSFWAGRLLKNLNGKRQKKADFVRFATAALSSQSVPANYDKMRLLGLHIACQYGVHINLAYIIRSLVCCCSYDLKFTLAEYFKPTIEDIYHVFCFVLFCFVLFCLVFFKERKWRVHLPKPY